MKRAPGWSNGLLAVPRGSEQTVRQISLGPWGSGAGGESVVSGPEGPDAGGKPDVFSAVRDPDAHGRSRILVAGTGQALPVAVFGLHGQVGYLEAPNLLR